MRTKQEIEEDIRLVEKALADLSRMEELISKHHKGHERVMNDLLDIFNILKEELREQS
jgi:hypothetical protein